MLLAMLKVSLGNVDISKALGLRMPHQAIVDIVSVNYSINLLQKWCKGMVKSLILRIFL